MTQSNETSVVDGELGGKERFRQLLDRIDFDDLILPAAEEAISWYDDELPYHNIAHMIEVTENVLTLCEERAITGYARQALCMAALWHDSAFPILLEPHEPTKEHRSAKLANEAILKCDPGYSLDESHELVVFADWVSTLVLSTHPDREPVNLYEELLNEADLLNLRDDVAYMLQKSAALYIEGLMLAGENIVGSIEDFIKSRLSGLGSWCSSTQIFLSGLIKRKIISENDLEKMANNIRAITPDNLLKMFKKQN